MRCSLPAMLIAALFTGSALAKLPPVSDEAKAKAAEAAAKTAWADKVGAYQLCKSMDRVAETYHKTAKAAGKDTPAASPTPACTDPGPFALTPTTSKPLEASGAHSPPGTATSPPSTNATSSQLTGGPKK